MDIVQRILLFRDLVDAGSFAAVGRRWGCSHSTVSRQIQALEVELSSRLLHRTTRSMVLTQHGKIVYNSAARMESELSALRDRLDEARGTISGDLRIVSLVHLARHVVQPAIASCLREHPQLRIHLSVDDGPLDVARDTPDIAVRVGAEHGGSYMAHQLMTNAVSLVATPGLLARCPDLQHPEQLASVPTVAYVSSAESITAWSYRDGKQTRVVTVDPVLRVDDGNLLADAVRSGVGIGYVSTFAVQAELSSGELVRVLPQWKLPPYAPVMVLTASRDGLSPRIEAMRVHLQKVAEELAGL